MAAKHVVSSDDKKYCMPYCTFRGYIVFTKKNICFLRSNMKVAFPKKLLFDNVNQRVGNFWSLQT